ncbi:MAG: GNAT family N-acetyltransferase [Candidatus Saccharibacteria bacterium]|nr:GNAT family N-acetyltransferase [Candidatus Saccharibacteria bacterium]
MNQDNQTISIKSATPDEAEIICDIRDRAWIDAYPNPELGISPRDIEINAKGLHGEFVPKRIAWFKGKLAKNDENWICYTAQINNVTVGFVIASTEDDGKKFINSIYIEPNFQGKGLGTMLMKKALDWLGSEKGIYLEVLSYNQNAIDFYKRFGFEKTDTVVPQEEGAPDYIKSLPQIEMVLKRP